MSLILINCQKETKNEENNDYYSPTKFNNINISEFDAIISNFNKKYAFDLFYLTVTDTSFSPILENEFQYGGGYMQIKKNTIYIYDLKLNEIDKFKINRVVSIEKETDINNYNLVFIAISDHSSNVYFEVLNCNTSENTIPIVIFKYSNGSKRYEYFLSYMGLSNNY